MLQVRLDLIFKFLAVDRASTSSCAGRVTTLDHEVWDYAVEDDAIVVAALGELREVLACLRRMLFVEFDSDEAL